ncbi:unnamed protein product [Penicillium camemberti]|uniref:Str. FM013 n=1 Tax=Penicillium camemberti (strain FM 013) TaxID=1429867 RepID=A0A0G4PAK3_PENC3|nr:unnamed protein product [Penicillium camemberti]
MPLTENPIILRTNKLIPLLRIQPPSRNKHILRPKPNPSIPRLARKPRTLLDQSTAEPKAPRARLNK